jgi:hypothetical protein
VNNGLHTRKMTHDMTPLHAMNLGLNGEDGTWYAQPTQQVQNATIVKRSAYYQARLSFLRRS